MVKPLGEVSMDELWRGELEVELAQFKGVQKQLTEVVAMSVLNRAALGRSRPIEVASQSEAFSKPVAKPRVNQRIEWMAQPSHYCVVFSIDRPPLLAVRCVRRRIV